MSKKRTLLHVRIPPYVHPRNIWRKQLNSAISTSVRQREVIYTIDDRLELQILLYIKETDVKAHDVDNRLKDIMDALQGRAGGPKKVRFLKAIIPNDNQINRVTIEKRVPPKQSKGLGHLIIRKYKE